MAYLWVKGAVHNTMGEFPNAISLLDQANQICTGLGDEEIQGQLLGGSDPKVAIELWRARCLWCMGELAASINATDTAIARANSLNHLPSLPWALYQHTMSLLRQNNVPEAQRNAEKLIELATHLGIVSKLCQGKQLLARCYILTGKVPEGISLLREGFDQYLASSTQLGATEFAANAAKALLGCQRGDEATYYVEAGLKLMKSSEEHYCSAELLRIEACLMRLDNQWAKSRSNLETAYELSRVQGADLYTLRIVTDMVQMDREDRVASQWTDSLADIIRGIDAGRSAWPDIERARRLLDSNEQSYNRANGIR